MIRIFVLFVFLLDITFTDSACTNTLPLSEGTWKTSNKGTWTINSGQTSIANFEYRTSSTGSASTATMECEDDSDTDGYIALKSSTTFYLFGGDKHVYVCVKFEQQTATNSDAYHFYFGSTETTLAVGVYERIILLPTSVAFTFAAFCTDKSTVADRTHVAIKNGTEANAAITCPTSIQGTFSYSNTSCSSTFLDVCTTLTQFNFNYTVCAEAQMFSADGQFYCVYSGTSGNYNYLTVYNSDATTPDDSTYYQYSCLVYTTANNIVTTSINPKECFDSSLQTPTSTVHPDGVTRTFTNYSDSNCYAKDNLDLKDDSSSSSTNLIWLYVLIVIIILIIIAIIIFLIWYIRRKRKREQQKVPDEESLQSSEDEEEQKKKDEEQKKADEEQKKKDEQQREASPVPAKEDDRTSIDSGIEQEKKEEKTPVKDKKVVIEDIKDKTEEDQGISDENSNDVTEQNENLVVEQQKIDNNENNLEKLDTNNTSGNDKFEQDNEESENKNDHVTNFEQSENEQQDINQDEQIIISSNEQDNEQRENKSDDKNDDDANFERSEDEEQNINKDEKIIRNSNDQNQTDNLNEKDEENSHDNNDPNIDDKSLCNDESKKIIVIATDKNDEINVKDNDIITKNEDEQNNVSNTKMINKENNENKDKHDKIKSDKTIEQKEVSEDDNENKDGDLEAETKDDKQRRSVKIYEKSDWNGPLEHQEKHVDIGEKSTEQIPKIITVKEQEEEKEQEEDEEEGEKSGSEETASSSRVTTPDPEEIERNIRKIGMKKSINFKPQGELSKVLVSRKMEEKSRKNQEMGKWKKMRSLFRVKTKKIKDVSQKKGNTNELALDSDEEEKQKAERENTVAPFMKEYNYKKQMEQQLDEQHVWGGEEDYTDRLKDSDDEDFADIFEVTTNEKGKEVIIEKTKIEEISDENKRSKYSKDSEEKEHLHEDEKSNKKQLTEDQAKDSGVDSPDLKKENTDIELKVDGDEEMGEVEMTEPPPGYIKDSSGRIIRLYDNKVMTEEEMQAIFPLAKLGVLFHVPRLKRTSHGRPTGDYIEDNFGPKLENDKRSGEARDEHSKPKHPRSSRGSAARRETKDQLFQKSVAFEMDDGQSDILMIEDEDAMSIGQGSTEANRELLRKRLFRNKRKLRSRGDDKLFSSDEGRPRELSDLVRVIPQTGQKYLTNGRAAIPGTVVSRNDSLKNKFDPEQQQIYREGLAADKRILEQSPSLKRHPPGVPREAFVHQNPDDIRVSIDNLENEERLRRNQDGINIGSDDEFFLVGNNREQQQEPLFTVRRPGQTTVRPVPGSHDRFCPKHDMRHALPWSLINQYHIRESSILDANSVAKKQLAPKSADNGKREIDDRRLRELLEELYKDKKYFDHMIDTTERNTEPIIDERDLAEHGRDFLLERAEYWDERGEMMPRPPQTALGLRLSRMNTFVPDSGRVSNISYASTVTPQPPPEQLQHHNNVPHAFQKREHTIT